MLDISEVARRCFPTFQLDAEGARAVGFGRALSVDLGRSDAVVAVFAPDGAFLALYRQDGDAAVPVAVFAG
jgi:tRNA pseudouridine55 synthase